jgi:integrase
MNITIFPKSPDAKGFVRLYYFVSVKNKPGWFPTKIKVLKESWDQDEQRIKSNQLQHDRLNGLLLKRKALLQKAFDALEYEEIAATVDLVRVKYNAFINHEITGNAGVQKKKKEHINFLEYIDLYVNERKNIRAKDYLRCFKPTKNYVAELLPNAQFSDITIKFYTDFVDMLIEEKEAQNNTVGSHISRIVTVMGAALIDPRTKHQDIPLDFKLFDDLYVAPKPFWLDWDTDLKKIEEKEVLPEWLRFKQEFLFRCYTGLRHSDVFNANRETFIHNKGKVYINFMAIKTKADQNLLLNPKAVAILEAWGGKPPRLYQHDCNSFIKLIGRAAKLNQTIEKVRYKGSERIVSILPKFEMITTHTARRTFGRRWMEQGGDIRYLSKYFGHASIQQTEEYIGWTTKEVNDEMMRVMG